MKINKHILSIFAVTTAMASLSQAAPVRDPWGGGEPATFAKWTAGREFGSKTLLGQGNLKRAAMLELGESGDQQTFPEVLELGFVSDDGNLRGAPLVLGQSPPINVPEPGTMAVNGLIGSLLIHRLSRRDRRRAR